MDTKIENLTEEQNRLLVTVAAQWEDAALGGDDSYKIDVIREGIDFIYELAELKSPEIVICRSPLDMAEQAKLKKGETIDYLGCGYDSGWTAFYDFMGRIGVKFDEDWHFDIWRRFILESGVFATVLCKNIAFVCVRPCVVHRTPEGNLHNEKGLAIEWADGYGEFFLNGVCVSEELITTPAEKLDPKMILKETNAEVRREIVRKIGIERVCQKLGAKLLDRQGDYELLGLDLGDGRLRPYLKMRNPSIAVWHIEGVPPGTTTVKDALKWRNGTDTTPIELT